MRRLRRFLTLPASERRLLLTAFFAMISIRTGLWVVRFDHLRRWLAAMRATETGRGRPTTERIAWAVVAASSFVPGATCLVQAMATHWLCARAGHRTQLRIGIGQDTRSGFTAHAWVDSGGQVLIGGQEVGRYARLLTLGAPKP